MWTQGSPSKKGVCGLGLWAMLLMSASRGAAASTPQEAGEADEACALQAGRARRHAELAAGAEECCVDTEFHCDHYKSLGYCLTVDNVKVGCRKTCGLCVVPGPDCSDIDPADTCASKKNSGLCDTDVDVRFKCQRTCGLCCQDIELHHCETYKSKGLCNECNVQQYCQGTCNVCATTPEPTTMGPTTEAPGTEAPTTEAPATEAPTTEAPGTEAPTTEAPGTAEPTTEAPGTEAPTTVVPGTEAPTTEAPTQEACVDSIGEAACAYFFSHFDICSKPGIETFCRKRCNQCPS